MVVHFELSEVAVATVEFAVSAAEWLFVVFAVAATAPLLASVRLCLKQ